MRRLLPTAALALLLASAAPATAGLYYSGESLAELPSQWRGFLIDQRMLRTVAVKPSGDVAPSPARARYEADAARLAKLARERKLSADEAADLGAVYVRLGEVGKALEVLRPAQKDHPSHFRVAANLGTAWQLHGDLAQAAASLQQAVRLAPGKLQKAEELHLRLVRQRAREDRDSQDLDDLFGVKYVGPSGKYEAGRLAEDQRKALPDDAAARLQQLALWLPGDVRLLWQVGELANAHGDVAVAAAIMDGCVTEFALRHPDLRAHRQAVRAAADERAKEGVVKADHEKHALPFKARSSRPLLNQDSPPPIDPKGLNRLPWSVVVETTLSTSFKPTFPRYLKELDGKQVQLTGYMQPLGEDIDCGSFMFIEFPVGCWYCETPEMTGIVLVELPPGKTKTYTRGALKVTGKLKLNADDPENFLYTLQDAEVKSAE
jgi:hypothetical protein